VGVSIANGRATSKRGKKEEERKRVHQEEGRGRGGEKGGDTGESARKKKSPPLQSFKLILSDKPLGKKERGDRKVDREQTGGNTSRRLVTLLPFKASKQRPVCV